MSAFAFIRKRIGGGNDGFTKLLLHCDGSDGSTTFTDSSASAHTVTVAGNAQIDTAQSKFGSASALFDSAGDYLHLGGSSDFAFGTGDFTIDFWVRLPTTAARFLYDSRTANGAYPSIYIESNNTLRYYVNSANRITGTNALSVDTWYHVAVARSGTNTKLFLNGTQEGSTWTDTTNYLNAASRPIIGRNGTFDGATMNGWLDEIRVSKGIARWTANFTAPSAAYS